MFFKYWAPITIWNNPNTQNQNFNNNQMSFKLLVLEAIAFFDNGLLSLVISFIHKCSHWAIPQWKKYLFSWCLVYLTRHHNCSNLDLNNDYCKFIVPKAIDDNNQITFIIIKWHYLCYHHYRHHFYYYCISKYRFLFISFKIFYYLISFYITQNYFVNMFDHS